MNQFQIISKMATRRAPHVSGVGGVNRITDFDRKGNVEHDMLIPSASCPPQLPSGCSKYVLAPNQHRITHRSRWHDDAEL